MFDKTPHRVAAVRRSLTLFVACAIFPGAGITAAQRTPLKPGWNMFSAQQDISLGKQAALDAQKQLPLCNTPKVDAYLTQLGMKLVAHLDTHGATYPWEFHCVNDRAINAFALPGGYVFINRGAIEAAKGAAEPIQLIVANGAQFRTFSVDYHGGLRYPHIEREEGRPDYLGEITGARVQGTAGVSGSSGAAN